ncbi:oligogalacturonate lyase family protein [Sphingomonas sp. dw_22]|uniref:oligogalacturonate lyase family protein n=1 Tax=Sphingomonas sp. dw_22 TaxID=2721175 RepID=UPI001BD4ADD4|nr:oligogalacturonate lyase family protein [Sphingomonas sp. dw_22]
MLKRLIGGMMLAAIAFAVPAYADDVGKRYPSETRTVVDRITGRPFKILTSGASSDSKIYPTHRQWTKDGNWIVFRSSDRAASGTPQAFVVNEITGDIVQITDSPGVNTGGLNVARLSNRIYYTRQPAGGVDGAELVEIDLGPLLADSARGKMRAQGYERVVAAMPKDGTITTNFGLDADEKTAYLSFNQHKQPPRAPGALAPQVPSGIRSVDIATGATRTILKTPWLIGHIQANPLKPGEVMYCHETGGDADQRMWLVNGDGSGNRPIYVEGPDDWVTHEQFADADHVIFNLMGHTMKLRQRPSGIMVVSLRDGRVENLGQTDSTTVTRSELKYLNSVNIPQDETNTGGYWHNGVTYDGRWAAGDDFDGNVHLIDRRTGKRTLLTTGHRMRPDHAHPSFSPDGTRVLLQSGMMTDGERLSLVIAPVPDGKDL